MRTNQQPLVQQSPGILDASVGARFDRLRAQTQRVLMALHVARPTRLALNDHTATVLALNQRLYLGAARLTFGSSTSGAPHAERCRAGRPLLVVHRGESSIGPRDDPRTVLRKNAENTAAYGAGGWRGRRCPSAAAALGRLAASRVESAGGREVVDLDPNRAVGGDGDVKQLADDVALGAARGLNVEEVHECLRGSAGR